jgi:putative ABC transport system substrate-binding protein
MIRFWILDFGFSIGGIGRTSIFVFVLWTMLFAPCTAGAAQQPTRIPRIGYLTAARLTAIASRTEAFRQGLRDLGYSEGKNLFIEWRAGDGNFDRLPALAAELVRLNVDIIVTGGEAATRAAKEVTRSIPIVMTQDDDPVGNGVVSSLARPGGNITGLSTLAPERGGKRLELLKEAVPGLSRVAVFSTSTEPSDARELKEIELAAKVFGIKLQYLDVLSFKNLEVAFRGAVKERAGAILMNVPGPIISPHRKEIAELAIRSRLPVIDSTRGSVEAGGLMSYGVSVDDLARRAATYVDKILKGAKPADLPVEQPTKFEFVINLKTAKQIGLTIPPNVLARADKVIK